MAVSRGLYQGSTLLVLDEPTASMGARAEHAVYDAVLHGQCRQDRITTLISHRLSSVTNCDMIYVFRDGRVIESGTHQDLMNYRSADGRLGEYRQMFTLQATAYQAEATAEKGNR